MNMPSTISGERWSRIALMAAVVSASCLLSMSAFGSDEQFTFGDEFQERVFQVRDGVFRTVALMEKFAPGATNVAENGFFRSLHGACSEFAVYPQTGDPLTAYDFAYSGRNFENVSTGGQRLVVRLTGRTAPIDVTLRYETEPRRPWMRKTIRITPQRQEGAEFVVSRIDVERFAYLTSAAEGGGIGQPLFIRNHFFGLEHPEGHNDYSGGVITLTNYPGVAVGNGLESKTAVWGVAPDGRARYEFLNIYLPSFALHAPSTPFVSFSEAWNCGYSCSETLTTDSIASLKETLVDRYGLRIDSYGNFGNWQDWQGIWQPNRKLFPRGFDPVQKAAQAAGMRLGLWFSLTGGNLDTHWAIAHGMEVRPRDVARCAHRNYDWHVAEPVVAALCRLGVVGRR